jgi:hypothetical protein
MSVQAQVRSRRIRARGIDLGGFNQDRGFRLAQSLQRATMLQTPPDSVGMQEHTPSVSTVGGIYVLYIKKRDSRH